MRSSATWAAAHDLSEQALRRHGDWPRWHALLKALPDVDTRWSIDQGRLVAGAPAADLDALATQLKGLLPWRKGPLRLGGVDIDTEWRSDWKWARLASNLVVTDLRVLDVGAGNGYFGWCLLAAGAKEVVGCDPSALFAMQHAAICHFSGETRNPLLALPLEDLPRQLGQFDVVMSMGVLYHRRDALAHLADLKQWLQPHGTLVLETLIVPDGHSTLVRPARYAGMRNVHAVPPLSGLQSWLSQSGYGEVRVLDINDTTPAEQGQTEWMPFHSLAETLQPDNPAYTIEGHPAPRRVMLTARP